MHDAERAGVGQGSNATFNGARGPVVGRFKAQSFTEKHTTLSDNPPVPPPFDAIGSQLGESAVAGGVFGLGETLKDINASAAPFVPSLGPSMWNNNGPSQMAPPLPPPQPPSSRGVSASSFFIPSEGGFEAAPPTTGGGYPGMVYQGQQDGAHYAAHSGFGWNEDNDLSASKLMRAFSTPAAPNGELNGVSRGPVVSSGMGSIGQQPRMSGVPETPQMNELPPPGNDIQSMHRYQMAQQQLIMQQRLQLQQLQHAHQMQQMYHFQQMQKMQRKGGQSKDEKE
jgi:hypothetical protein